MDTTPWRTTLEGCRILRCKAWRPSLEQPKPDIRFVEARLRRRLSMLSSMALHTLHALGPLPAHCPLFFVSFRGELNQQLKVNRMLFEEGALLPAAFSLSVFNTPPALCCMALGLKAGYAALYPAENGFPFALAAAAAALKTPGGRPVDGTTQAASPLPSTPPLPPYLAFLYADELPAPEYASLLTGPQPEALAFALLLAGPAASGEGREEAGREGLALPTLPPADCQSPQHFWAALAAHFGPNGVPHV